MSESKKDVKARKIIQFDEFHQPDLKDGTYHVEVMQRLEASGVDKEAQGTVWGVQETFFSVVGPRFSLQPQEVGSVFPPNDNVGDHANALPHVILKRSTLPWERYAIPPSPQEEEALEKRREMPGDMSDNESKLASRAEEKRATPWLALLLFDEDDPPPKSARLALSDLLSDDPPKGYEKFAQYLHNLPRQITGDEHLGQVSVIKASNALLDAIIPRESELRHLAHVRQWYKEHPHENGSEAAADNVAIDGDLAVIMGNRLPRPGKQTTAHLVSLEGRYDENGVHLAPEADGDVCLVSLKSWRFTCIDPKASFSGLLKHLNNHPSTLRLPDIPRQWRVTLEDTTSDPHGKIKYWTVVIRFDGNELTISKTPPRRKMPEAGDKLRETVVKRINDKAPIKAIIGALDEKKLAPKLKAIFHDHGLDHEIDLSEAQVEYDQEQRGRIEVYNRYARMSYVPTPHYLRGGEKTLSWYRGPLVSGMPASPPSSLPARNADELLVIHKPLGMFDVSYAAAWELGRMLMLQSKPTSLSLYQWKRSHAQQVQQTRYAVDHLPWTPVKPEAEMPQTVQAWLSDLAVLKGLPFNYLVPDDRLLPSESIRFFRVDPAWVDCLLDGAFSIGRISQQDQALDKKLIDAAKPRHTVTGFLLRSEVVSGWSELQVDGYAGIIEGIVTPSEDPLPMLRPSERLSSNVMICLFDGEVKTVDIHLKPEVLHFGVNRLGEDHSFPGGYYKELRNHSGEEDIEGKAITDASIIDTLHDPDASNAEKIAALQSVMPEIPENAVITHAEDDRWRVLFREPPSQAASIPSDDDLHWAYYLYQNGMQLDVHKTLAVNVPPRVRADGAEVSLTAEDARNKRVIDIDALFLELEAGLQHFDDGVRNDFTSADFALEMIEGVPKVRFTKGFREA